MLPTKEERNQDKSARPAPEREDLIAKHAPLIKLHVSRLATQLFSVKAVDQLVNAGVTGLIEAAESYDKKSGEPDFKVHADQCIQAAISARISVLNGKPCPMPVARKSARSAEKLRPKLKYEAKDLELALVLGIDIEQLASFALMAQIAGISLGGFSEGSKTPVTNPDDRPFCYDPDPQSDGPECLVKRVRILRILTQSINELPKSERLVMALYYVEELTVKEIAMVLRVGEWRVLQLHTKAILRLRTSLRLHIGPHEQIIKRRD